MVGTSGSKSRRLALVTERGRKSPFLICGEKVDVSPKIEVDLLSQ
jgi:hypothetical protein